MSDPLAVQPQNKVLALATAAGVAALAIGGFTLSFTALRELAQREFAIAPQLSFIYPLVIDGFIVIATAAAFTMKQRGPQVTWYPWSAIALFGGLSVLGNAAHAIDSPSATFPTWLSALGASVPAIALLIASHLMVMMIDGKERPAVSNKRRPATAQPAEPKQPVATASALVEASTSADSAPPTSGQAVDGSLVDRLAAMGIAGTEITASLIAELEGVSERTGRRRLADLRESSPELFEAREAVAA